MMRPSIGERRVRNAGVLIEPEAVERSSAHLRDDAHALASESSLAETGFANAEEHASLRFVGPQLLDAYARAGKFTEVAKLIDDLLTDAHRAFPKDSPQMAGLLAQLGMTLLERNGFAVAEPLIRECLAIREKAQPDAWQTFNTQSMLGGALLGQKKYADAEPLLLAGYEGMKAREKTIPPQANTRVPEALDRLIGLYTATDKSDEAKKWRAERAKYPSPRAPMPREVK